MQQRAGTGAPSVTEDEAAAIEAKLAGGQFEVPLLPQVANQVMAICGDADCEIRSLTDTIKQDQALMAHVMRMANSALYAPDVPIVSVQLAVNRLGLTTVRDLAVAAACKGAVFKPGTYKELVARLFRQAMVRGVYAQEIARLRRRNVEVAFLAGLMAEIGAPVIVFACEGSSLTVDRVQDLIAAHLHDVSLKVLESWELPEKLVESVRLVHHSEDAGELAELIQTVALAQLLAGSALGSEREEDVLDELCIALNLFADDIDQLDARRDEIVAMVENLA